MAFLKVMFHIIVFLLEISKLWNLEKGLQIYSPSIQNVNLFFSSSEKKRNNGEM